MPAVFIFAVLFTVLMLEGKKAILISAFELLIYACICGIAYKHPDYVVQYTTEEAIVLDIIFSYSAIGMICGIVLYYHIKEYSHQRALLENQNDKLKHYDEVKSTFLTTVAHEIKNPLNIIGLYAQDTMELTDEDEMDISQIKQNQTIIQNTVVRLDRIVMDLMDTVSIEQGRLNLTLSSMNLVTLIQDSVDFWFAQAEHQNNNVLKMDLQAEYLEVYADYTRLFQVMTNLLSNAFLHTKNGTICVTVKRDGEKAFVSVKDTGEGMRKEIKENAFKGYVSTSKDYWRHGIGLYICHQVIEAHQGNIWIESEVNKGCEIAFTLPIREV